MQQKLALSKSCRAKQTIVSAQEVCRELLAVGFGPRMQAFVVKIKDLDMVAVVGHYEFLRLGTYCCTQSG